MTEEGKLWNFSRASQGAFECLLFLIFFLLGLAYFTGFSYDLGNYLFREGYFQLALNSHDHLVYVETIKLIAEDGIQYGFNNDFGIAAIYLALTKLFPVLVNEDLTILSFVVNVATLIPAYILWIRICDHYDFGFKGRIAFFANTSLLYFMQLVNKDMLTVLAFLFVINAGINRRLGLLLVFLPLLFLVRQQLAIFTVLFVYFMLSPAPRKRIVFAYVVSSVAAGLLSVFASIIGEDSMGDGFNAFLIQLNSQYYVGYLIFNPVRIVQYVLDAYSSFWFFTDSGGVDMAKLLRLPQLVLLAFLWRPISELVTRFNFWMTSPLKPVVLTIVAYLLAWLMNPTVNARYVMLITPVILIFALYVRRHNRMSLTHQEHQ